MTDSIKTIEFQVIADFPWTMHKVGDIIKVYENICRAYVVQVPDYGDGAGESEKFDLRDFPDIYRCLDN